MGVTVKVACPVCRESLEYQHEPPEAWGIIRLDDLACAEITINDTSGRVNSHMAAHREDGTHMAAVEERWKQQAKRAEAYFERKAGTA